MTWFMYVYRDDEADGRELRYSMRGLERHWVGETPQVLLVGDRPSWCSEQVVHLDVPQSGGREVKVRNILRSVLAGARELSGRGVDDAVYMDDDFVLLEPQREVLPLYRGTWQEYAGTKNRLWEPGIEWYVQGMRVTEPLVEHVPEPKSFEVHRPMPFVPAAACALLPRFADRDPDKTPFWRSLYGNVVGYPDGGPYLARDVRTAGGSYPIGTPWVSTDQKYWDKVAKRLEERLPEPSRWER